MLELAVLILFPALMAFAGAMDLLTMTIPNRVALALVAGFFCLAPFAGLGWEAVGLHVAAGAAMLIAGIGCFAMGWIGGGDAKLFAATALWVGHEHLFHYALTAAILGGVLTLALLFVRMMPLPAGLVRREWIARLHDSDRGIPYGIALAAAGLLIYPYTPWMQAIAQG